MKNHRDRTFKVEQHVSFGIIWIIGWLFTVGFLKHSFWQGALALIIWPYSLGAYFAEVSATEMPRPKQVSAEEEAAWRGSPDLPAYLTIG